MNFMNFIDLSVESKTILQFDNTQHNIIQIRMVHGIDVI